MTSVFLQYYDLLHAVEICHSKGKNDCVDAVILHLENGSSIKYIYMPPTTSTSSVKRPQSAKVISYIWPTVYVHQWALDFITITLVYCYLVSYIHEYLNICV